MCDGFGSEPPAVIELNLASGRNFTNRDSKVGGLSDLRGEALDFRIFSGDPELASGMMTSMVNPSVFP